MFNIRPATNSDINSITAIARSCITSSGSGATSGFIDYPQELLDKIPLNIEYSIGFVADTHKPVGFIFATPHDKLQRVYGDDPVILKTLELGRKPFLYVDPLGVLPEYRARGLTSPAIALFRAVAQIPGYSELWSPIVHKPVRNTSGALAEKIGFTCEAEIDLDEKIGFGLYRFQY
jgi:hypothetical protein